MQRPACMRAPAQINIPRDMWTQVVDIELPKIVAFERPQGGDDAVAEAAALISNAKFPVILNGAGVVLADAFDAVAALAERLDAPVCVGYQHNDAFPGLASPVRRSAGLQRLESRHGADLTGGCRPVPWARGLNPFSTLAGLRYRLLAQLDAKIIQVDINPDRIGLTKPVAVGIIGDAKKRGIRAS